MCDWVSWLERDGDLYWMRDAEIEARYGEVTNLCGGHSTIREYYKFGGGVERESYDQIPPQIAQSVNRGEMDKLATVMGWRGVRYSARGRIISPWWMRVQEAIKTIKLCPLDNHGPID